MPKAINHTYSILAMLFVGLLLTANILGPKPVLIYGFVIPAGLLVFPLTYVIGVVLSEHYGFKNSRFVIWVALLLNIFMALACQVAIHLPHSNSWQLESSYAAVLNLSNKLTFFSVFAYFMGEITNAFIVYKLKQQLHGKFFSLRALCGNWIGETIETFIFIPSAFSHLPWPEVWQMCKFYLLFKWLYAIVAIAIYTNIKKFLLLIKAKLQ